MTELLNKLCSLSGVSGAEDSVRDFIRTRAITFADDIRTDAMGNLMVFRKGKRSTKKPLMITAHMDEVGFIIKRITDDGMLKFGFVGGIDPRVVIGRHVRFGDTIGVVGIKAVHLTSVEDRKHTPDVKDLYIDIGACSKSEAENKVELGDYGVFDSDFSEFGDGLVKSKALDNRIGCTVLLQLLRKTPPVDTWFVFTVQEEVGLRGATTAAFAIDPALCINIEGTAAADLPEVKPYNRACAIRKGVVLPFMDKSAIYDEKLFNLLRKIADDEQIQWQTKTAISGSTDIGAIHKSLEGIPCACVAAPVRYIHSANCVAAIQDIHCVLHLMQAFISKFNDKTDFI